MHFRKIHKKQVPINEDRKKADTRIYSSMVIILYYILTVWYNSFRLTDYSEINFITGIIYYNRRKDRSRKEYVTFSMYLELVTS